MKFSDKNRSVNLELPVKITCEGQEFWVKKSAKTAGIYLNNIPPQEKDVLPISDSVRKPNKIQ